MDTALLKSLLLLADIIEARDPYTGGHVWRVSQISKLLAIKVGLTEVEALQISLGGYLHDLGKIGIPDAILLKSGKLTEQEFEIIKTHPLIGMKLIAEHPLSALVCGPIVEHHERPDGNGYPNGLSGDQISLPSRIVAIADALDAMTSTRPYRKGLPPDRVLAIIEQGVGTQFDTSLVGHLSELERAGDLGHVIGHSAEGIPVVTCPTCGPIIAIPRTARDGDVVFCRACTGKLVLHKAGDTFDAELAGRAESAFDLQARPNDAAIDDLVKQIPETLKSM